MTSATESALALMRAAGLPDEEAREWSDAFPAATGEYESDARRYGAFWRRSAALLQRLPPKPRRNEAEQAAAEALLTVARGSRESFLAAHVDEVYDLLTERCSKFRRLDDLVYDAAKLHPGLVPTREEVAAEAVHRQGDKDGVEIDQGLFFAHVLSRPRIGEHLCHAMLLAAAGERRARRRIRLARLARAWAGAPHPKRQGRPSRHDQSALSQRRGRHDARRDRARR